MECRKSGYAEKQAYLLYGLCQRKLGTFKKKNIQKIEKKLEKKRIKKRTKRIVRKVKRIRKNQTEVLIPYSG
jgi:hypothetical protein